MLGDFVRDKDSIGASCLLLEMAAYYFNRGMTISDALNAVYEEYGYFADRSVNVTMEGIDGLLRMRALMKELRENPPSEIAGHKVVEVRDYRDGTLRANGETTEMELSGSNVLAFTMEDGTQLNIRPSGTEPKIKTYILASGKTPVETNRRVDGYADFAAAFLK
jgi:phosphoglucomutase